MTVAVNKGKNKDKDNLQKLSAIARLASKLSGEGSDEKDDDKIKVNEIGKTDTGIGKDVVGLAAIRKKKKNRSNIA